MVLVDKNWIENNLLTMDKTRINNRISNSEWWINRQFANHYEWIQNQYPFDNIFQSLYHIYHSMSREIPKCHCGNHLKFKQFHSGYQQYCSSQCSYSDDTRNKKISNNRDMKKIVEKTKETTLKKYGVSSYFQTDEFKEKSNVTKSFRWGDRNYNNSKQRVTTNIERYGRGNGNGLRQNSCPPLEELYDLNYNKGMKAHEIAEIFGVTQKTIYDWFRQIGLEYKIHAPDHQKLQRNFAELLPSGFITNDRKIIYPLELDIYYPEKKLAIEINGLYWHSEDRQRHLNKMNHCNEKGITLLQFWDYEIIEKRDIVLSMIHHRLGMNKTIGARQCIIRTDISNEEYKNFLNENHIQGYIPSKIRIGLQYDNSLVSIVGLSKPRFDKSVELELIRFCNVKGMSVTGGLSRIMTHFSDKTMVSYSDRRIFEGNVHGTAGFQYEGHSTPGFFWFKKTERLSRYQCQKHRLPVLLGSRYDETLSSTENMLNNGWKRVFDCGQNKFMHYGACE